MPTVYRTFQKIHVTGIRQNQDEADQDTTILNLIGNVLPLKGHLLGKTATAVWLLDMTVNQPTIWVANYWLTL